MSKIVPIELSRGLSLIHRADMNHEPAKVAQLREEAVRALQKIAAPEHATPRAAYEIGRLAFKQAESLIASERTGLDQVLNVRCHLSSAIDYYNMSASMAGKGLGLSPAAALEELAYLHENGLMRRGELLEVSLKEQAGQAPDLKTAFTLRMKAAELGLFDAQMKLGVMFYLGHGTNASLKQAYRWLSKARHNPKGQSAETLQATELLIDKVVSDMNHPPRPVLYDVKAEQKTEDIEEAYHLLAETNKLRKDGDLHGYETHCGDILSLLAPYVRGVRPDPRATFHLGMMHQMRGQWFLADKHLSDTARREGARQDFRLAAYHFKRTVQKTTRKDRILRAGALYGLSVVYEQAANRLPPAFKAKCIAMRFEAAERGYSDAQFDIAHDYFTGEGLLPCDYAQSRLWANRARDNTVDPMQVDLLEPLKDLERALARIEEKQGRPAGAPVLPLQACRVKPLAQQKNM